MTDSAEYWKLVDRNAELRVRNERLSDLVRRMISEWDQYFDAEGPLLPDGDYRWSSQTAAGIIEEMRRETKQTEVAGADGQAEVGGPSQVPTGDPEEG